MSYYRAFIKPFLTATLFCGGLIMLSACQTISVSELSRQTQTEIDRIDIGTADSRLKQIFNRALDDNLNQQSALRDLALNTKLTTANSSTLAVQGKSSSLSKTTMTLSYELSDKMSGDVLLSGTISATATSGTVSSYYGQDKSKEFAAERLTGQLADRLSLRLRRYFLKYEQKDAS